eukprot:364005_1
MSTSIVRRKRSRNEFDADIENIDLMAIGNVNLDQPRKKPRTTTQSITCKSNTTKQIDTNNNKSITSTDNTATNTQAKKRAYSQTDFSNEMNNNYDQILKECSPNKKIKTINHSTRMMVDNDTDNKDKESIELSNTYDDEGDALMESNNKNKTISAVHIDFVPGSKRRNKHKYGPNRIRRSGLAFCVECGIGISG